jgi:hypothetical protein
MQQFYATVRFNGKPQAVAIGLFNLDAIGVSAVAERENAHDQNYVKICCCFPRAV